MKNTKLWNKDFIIIIIINFLVFLNHLMILSTFPFFIEYLGYGESISGVCVALFCFISVLLRPLVGYMLDTGKRKIILLIGIILMGLMPLGYLLVYTVIASIVLTFCFRLFHGAALAFSNTSTATIASDIIPKKRFSEGMGMFGMATALATAIAPAIGQSLMNKGFEVLFTFATIIMVISLILFYFLKTPKIEEKKVKFSVKNLIEKNAVPASIVVLIFLLTYGTLENYILKFATSEKNITITGGLYFTLMAVMLLISRIVLGKLTDKKGEAIFVYTCNIAMLIALLILGVCPNNVTFIISALLSGYAFGSLEPALQGMAVNIVPANRRGAANSTFLCAYDIGIGIGGFIAGVLIDILSYRAAFLIIMLANILSIIIYLIIGKNHESSITYRIKNNLN